MDEKLTNEIIVGNPVTDELVVSTTKEIKLIQVYSITGSHVLTTYKKITNVSDLAKGLYIVVIQTDDNIQKQVKIIKQ